MGETRQIRQGRDAKKDRPKTERLAPIQMKRSPTVRKTPLRKASPKRSKELALYRKERDAWLAVNNRCIICGWVSHDVHHRAGRNGKRLRDQSEWLAVCRYCHCWIHNFPKSARLNGWLK